nr:hypothetical protein CFP56_22254 [Quercus suber]
MWMYLYISEWAASGRDLQLLEDTHPGRAAFGRGIGHRLRRESETGKLRAHARGLNRGHGREGNRLSRTPAPLPGFGTVQCIIRRRMRPRRSHGSRTRPPRIHCRMDGACCSEAGMGSIPSGRSSRAIMSLPSGRGSERLEGAGGGGGGDGGGGRARAILELRPRTILPHACVFCPDHRALTIEEQHTMYVQYRRLFES